MANKSRIPAIVKKRLAEEKISQTQLGEEVADIEGRDRPYAQSTVQQWLAGTINMDPSVVFALEKLLGFSPGELSALDGYMPTNGVIKKRKGEKEVREMIAQFPDLTRDQQDTLYAVYDGLARLTRKRRGGG